MFVELATAESRCFEGISLPSYLTFFSFSATAESRCFHGVIKGENGEKRNCFFFLSLQLRFCLQLGFVSLPLLDPAVPKGYIGRDGATLIF